MIEVFKDPESETIAVVYDEGDGGIYLVHRETDGTHEVNEVPGVWIKLVEAP